MTTAPERPIIEDALHAGTLLGGRYRLGALIGRGGVASVYLGEDLALGRPVAVKVFEARAEGIDDPARRTRETALLASVAHPSLVTLFDAGRDEATGREYLVMEFVDGPDLGRRIAAGPLTPTELAALVRELAEALQVIHGHGIVHRDVKPGNVLLTSAQSATGEWRAKLADFGIARLVDDAGLTATGQLLGTPAYLSPEQVRGLGAGPAADVYALGLVAIEAATGERVYPGPGIEAAGARLVRDPEIPEWLGPGWCELLSAMVARDPGRRPTALEVAVRVGELPPPGVAPAGPNASAEQTGALTPVTLVLGPSPNPAPEARVDEAPVATGAAVSDLPGEGAADRRGGSADRHETGPRRRTARRTGILGVVTAGIVVAVTAVVMIVSALLGGADRQAGSDPTVPPMPSVEGELGVHLEQLEEAVTP